MAHVVPVFATRERLTSRHSARAPIEQANKERLGVLLAEVQNKSDNEERYRSVGAKDYVLCVTVI